MTAERFILQPSELKPVTGVQILKTLLSVLLKIKILMIIRNLKHLKILILKII